MELKNSEKVLKTQYTLLFMILKDVSVSLNNFQDYDDKDPNQELYDLSLTDQSEYVP